MKHFLAGVSRARDTLMTSQNKYGLCPTKREGIFKKKKGKRTNKNPPHFFTSLRITSVFGIASLRIESIIGFASASHRITSTSNHIYNFIPLTRLKRSG